jgi:hypothetical protein
MSTTTNLSLGDNIETARPQSPIAESLDAISVVLDEESDGDVDMENSIFRSRKRSHDYIEGESEMSKKLKLIEEKLENLSRETELQMLTIKRELTNKVNGLESKFLRERESFLYLGFCLC